jgi:hypothetical protein
MNLPKISAKFETVTPAMADVWLATMVPNRKLKEATVAMYANDMANGSWLLSPQGIAFDDADHLFDGQHRLRGILRAQRPVTLLVLRGFPAKQDDFNTMDAVDCGAGRSLPDRLKLMGCHPGNPNLVCAVAKQIALAVMGKNNRSSKKISLANTLAVIDLWKAEITMVCRVIDRPGFSQIRNAEVVAALAIAAAVSPKRTQTLVETLASGAGLDRASPILELRNSYIAARCEERGEKLALCLSAVLCEWYKLTGREIHREENKKTAANYFREKQADRFAKVETLFRQAQPAA